MSATVDALRAMHDKAKRWLTGRYKEEAARSNETWGSPDDDQCGMGGPTRVGPNMVGLVFDHQHSQNQNVRRGLT